jgi:hypothetical protein
MEEQLEAEMEGGGCQNKRVTGFETGTKVLVVDLVIPPRLSRL